MPLRARRSHSWRFNAALATSVALVASFGSLSPGAGAATVSFSNPITVPDASVASTYPSTIIISGVGTDGASYFQGLEVTLNGITSGAAQHLDFLVQAANGSTFVPFEHVGGAQSGQSWTAGNTSATITCGAGTLATGTYQPTQCPPAATFPTPAPSPPYGGLGSVDYGDANGAWGLYVRDDTPGGGSSSISGGWTLTLNVVSYPTGCFSCSGGGGGGFTTPPEHGCGRMSVQEDIRGEERNIRTVPPEITDPTEPRPPVVRTRGITCRQAFKIFSSWAAKCLPFGSEKCRLTGGKVLPGARGFKCTIDWSGERPVRLARDTLTCVKDDGDYQTDDPLAEWLMRRSEIPFAAGFHKEKKEQ